MTDLSVLSVLSLRSPETILAEAKTRLDFEPFTPINMSRFANGGGNRLHDFFAALSADEHQSLNAWIMRNSEKRSFAAVHRALRIVNGLTYDQLAKTLSTDGNTFNHQTIYATEHEKIPILRRYINALDDVNPFKLSPGDLKNFTGRTPLADRKSAISDIARQIADYKAGKLPLNAPEKEKSLISRNEVIKHLLDFGYNPYCEISRQLFPEKQQEYLSGIFSGNIALEDDMLKTLAVCLGIDTANTAPESDYGLLLALPYKTHDPRMPKHFAESARQDMVAPEVKRVFDCPEHYASFGKWLQALREASQQTQDEIAPKSGYKNRQGLDNMEKNMYRLQPAYTDRILADNIYFLPVAGDGKVPAAAQAQFRQLAECRGEAHWKKRCDDIFIPWDVAQSKLAAAMKTEFPAVVWNRYYQNELAEDGKGDEGRTTVILEGRTLGVRIADDRLTCNNGEILHLCKDADFLRRLKAHLESLQREMPGLSETQAITP